MLFSSVEFIFFFLPTVAAVYFGLAHLMGRRTALAWLIVSSLVFYGFWNPPYLALLVGFGVWTILPHLAITQAYRIASPPALAPFDYTTLVWALLWGWLIWGEWPSASTLLGAFVVVLAGLYVVYRESRPDRIGHPLEPR